MKRFLILSICLFAVYMGIAQNQEAKLIRQRDSILQLYKAHKDTVSKNTWINIMQTNNYLNHLIRLDSALIDLSKADKFDSLSRVYAKQVNGYDKLVKSFSLENAQLQQDNRFNKRMYFMLLVISGLFLILIVVLLLLTGKSNKAVKEKEQQLKTYHTDLFAAREEIEKARTTENQLASEINKLKKLLDGNPDSERLKEEKLMLENQIIEVKKAYELESEKRRDLEARLAQMDKRIDKESDDNEAQEFNSILEQNKRFQAEMDNLLSRIDKLEALNSKLQDEASSHINAREITERKYNELIERIQNISKDF